MHMSFVYDVLSCTGNNCLSALTYLLLAIILIITSTESYPRTVFVLFSCCFQVNEFFVQEEDYFKVNTFNNNF